MNQNELQQAHSELVRNLAKPGADIIASLTPLNAHLWHMASAVCGEAGELFDAIKRQAIYCKELDVENVVEELGDLEFYLEGIRGALGITREQTLDANLAKLNKRYQSGKYSNAESQQRADKVETSAQTVNIYSIGTPSPFSGRPYIGAPKLLDSAALYNVCSANPVERQKAYAQFTMVYNYLDKGVCEGISIEDFQNFLQNNNISHIAITYDDHLSVNVLCFTLVDGTVHRYAFLSGELSYLVGV